MCSHERWRAQATDSVWPRPWPVSRDAQASEAHLRATAHLCLDALEAQLASAHAAQHAAEADAALQAHAAWLLAGQAVDWQAKAEAAAAQCVVLRTEVAAHAEAARDWEGRAAVWEAACEAKEVEAEALRVEACALQQQHAESAVREEALRGETAALRNDIASLECKLRGEALQAAAEHARVRTMARRAMKQPWQPWP